MRRTSIWELTWDEKSEPDKGKGDNDIRSHPRIGNQNTSKVRRLSMCAKGQMVIRPKAG